MFEASKQKDVIEIIMIYWCVIGLMCLEWSKIEAGIGVNVRGLWGVGCWVLKGECTDHGGV